MLQRGAECRSEERKGPSPRRTWGGREDAQRLQQLCWEERLRELGLWCLEKAVGGTSLWPPSAQRGLQESWGGSSSGRAATGQGVTAIT